MARAPDTLKPYQPTLRNRISTALLGDAKASSVRGRFVKGLMGDTGLSATGLGIVDLLPFLQADEAGRQLATKGQRAAGAGNLALSVIPIPAVANKLVKPAVKKAAKGVSRLIGDVVGEAAPTVSKIADAMEGARPIPVPVVGGPPRNAEGFSAPPVPVTQPQITAYHGSPHDFEKFSLDKIGTGEGAQAYGHGLYFAESEGVAKQYRDQLSRTIGDPHSMATAQVANHGGDRAAAAQYLRANLDAERAKPNPDASWLDRYTPVLQVLESSAPVASDAGHMYQVGINADPERFLDWDKPFSQQPPSVQESLKTFGYAGDYPHELAVQGPDINERFVFNSAQEAENEAARWRALGGHDVQGPWEAQHQQPLTGEQIYRDFRDQPSFRQAGAETKALADAGIPGIKYLDANSRNAGGWHITPPSETVSGKWMVKGSDYNSKGLQFDTEAEAKAALAEKIGGQTRNFVVFDEKLITILKKYGWVPGAALPAAAVAEYTKENGSPPPTVPMV